MWDRKELKFKGKAAYRANRLTCIIAALLLMIASGAGFSGASAGSSWNSVQNNINNTPEYSDDYLDDFTDDYLDDLDDIDAYDDIDDIDDLDDLDIYNGSPSVPRSSLIAPAIAGIVIVIILIVAILGTAIGVFLLNPLQVGVQKFFIDNASDQSTGLNRSNVGVAFNENYIKVVGSMFTTGLFTALWTLLLIIPGIYKAYCWRMVPYIVSEDPTISGSDARALSAQMMNGSKWASFVLDLSFLGWQILGLFTLGILNLVFTNPYQAATNAELYLTLSGRPSEVASPAETVQKSESDVVIEFDQEGTND